MLHNSAVYISKLAYPATPLPREEAGDIKRKGPRHHVATLPPDGCFVAYIMLSSYDPVALKTSHSLSRKVNLLTIPFYDDGGKGMMNVSRHPLPSLFI